MGWHEALSEDEQAAFTLGLRPLLNSVWEGVLGDPAVYTAVNRGLAEYMLSDYCHNDRLLGPEDAYEPAAAATLNAAYAYLFRCTDFAVWASRRAIDDQHLEYLAGAGLEEGDFLDTDKALIDELKRQLRDLDLIAARECALHDVGARVPSLSTRPLSTAPARSAIVRRLGALTCMLVQRLLARPSCRAGRAQPDVRRDPARVCKITGV
ncbi:hypothetical protein [Streptomyces sp. NBC_01546]|uniref:hypothetical protein n=1 Tax=Streptomyces sp. NBC_01546 TaxID=2975872 RepID=UPI003867EAF7